MSEKTIGQVCYEAFTEQMDPKRYPRKAWDSLHPNYRRKWENAAMAVHGLEVVAVVRPKRE